MKIVILLDIGKTLIDSEAIVRKSLADAADKLKSNNFIKSTNAFIKAYINADKVTRHEHINHTYSDLRIIKKAWIDLGNSDDFRLYAYFLHYYRSRVRRCIRPQWKIISMLERMRTKGILFGIVSDGTITEQLETLVRLKIIDYINPKYVFISENIGVEKSNAHFYHRVLSKIQHPKRRIVIVGDRLEADIIIPQSVGLKTILLLRYAKYPNKTIVSAGSDFVIKNLLELEKVIDKLY